MEKNINKAENNYATIEKELLAIVWAVKYFKQCTVVSLELLLTVDY